MANPETVDYSATIADLEAKRAALDAAIAAFRAAQSLGALGQSGDGATTAVPFSASGNEVPVGAFLGKSIPEAAKLCLQIVKRKMTSREIADALRKGGIESTSKSFSNLVHTILIRAAKPGGDLVKLDKSHWGLAAWYPVGLRSSGAVEKRPVKRRKQRSPKPAESKPQAPKLLTDGPKPKDRILQVLGNQPGIELSAQELANHLGLREQTVHLVLGNLMRKNSILKTVSGKYRKAA